MPVYLSVSAGITRSYYEYSYNYRRCTAAVSRRLRCNTADLYDQGVKTSFRPLRPSAGILEDTQVVTGMVSSASKEVEDAVSSLSESSVDMAHFISENKIPLKPLSV